MWVICKLPSSYYCLCNKEVLPTNLPLDHCFDMKIFPPSDEVVLPDPLGFLFGGIQFNCGVVIFMISAWLSIKQFKTISLLHVCFTSLFSLTSQGILLFSLCYTVWKCEGRVNIFSLMCWAAMFVLCMPYCVLKFIMKIPLSFALTEFKQSPS